jgi:hypothetical protein
MSAPQKPPHPRSFDVLLSPERIKQLSLEDFEWLVQNEGFARSIMDNGLEDESYPEPVPSKAAGPRS